MLKITPTCFGSHRIRAW